MGRISSRSIQFNAIKRKHILTSNTIYRIRTLSKCNRQMLFVTVNTLHASVINNNRVHNSIDPIDKSKWPKSIGLTGLKVTANKHASDYVANKFVTVIITHES